MSIIQPYQYSEFFGGHWPEFAGQGELTLNEFNRNTPLYGRYMVTFQDPDPFIGWMFRAFNSKEEILDYLRQWGLGASDIHHIDDYTPHTRERWVVLAHDPFYGTVSSKEGYRRRWYFDTQAEADAFAETLEKPWYLDDVYLINEITF